ncbi:MAG: BatD family protein, partial [Planctomycetes bacterium]|nr:BatD family protein [Planctomycetota bacterium]
MSRIAAWVVLACVALVGATAPAAPVGDPRAFVALDAGTRSVFVGQSFDVTLRIGIEPTLLRDHLVPVFQRAADVPVRVTAPDLANGDREGRSITRIEPSGDVATLGLGDEVARAARVGSRIVDGRPYAVFELRFRLVVASAGACSFAAPRLEFASATRFDEDLFQGRVPVDRVEATVDGEAETVQVLALPRQGVPDTFRGAIGRVTLDVTTEAHEVAVGEEFTVSVTLGGDGASDAAPDSAGPPDWTQFVGFHVRGVLEHREAATRRFDVTLVPTSTALTAIPALRYASFDPTDGGTYVEVASRPVPLTVRAAASGATTLGGAAQADGASERDAGRTRDELRGVDPAWWVVGGLAVIAFAVVLRSVRRVEPTADGVGRVSRIDEGKRTAQAARVELARPPIDAAAQRARCEERLGEDAERAVVAYLAATMRVPEAAVHG